jgi:hypothetical protein
VSSYPLALKGTVNSTVRNRGTPFFFIVQVVVVLGERGPHALCTGQCWVLAQEFIAENIQAGSKQEGCKKGPHLSLMLAAAHCRRIRDHDAKIDRARERISFYNYRQKLKSGASSRPPRLYWI